MQYLFCNNGLTLQLLWLWRDETGGRQTVIVSQGDRHRSGSIAKNAAPGERTPDDIREVSLGPSVRSPSSNRSWMPRFPSTHISYRNMAFHSVNCSRSAMKVSDQVFFLEGDADVNVNVHSTPEGKGRIETRHVPKLYVGLSEVPSFRSKSARANHGVYAPVWHPTNQALVKRCGAYVQPTQTSFYHKITNAISDRTDALRQQFKSDGSAAKSKTSDHGGARSHQLRGEA